MKFGRFHGIVLCAFGLLLLLAQGVILMRRSVPQEHNQPVRIENKNPLLRIFTFFHPGIFTIIHPPPGFLFKFLTASFLHGNHQHVVL
jgi:hypothetical protein